jgi:hypothetical protein
VWSVASGTIAVIFVLISLRLARSQR